MTTVTHPGAIAISIALPSAARFWAEAQLAFLMIAGLGAWYGWR